MGSARGSDGKAYNLESDMRMFSGTYVPSAGPNSVPAKVTFAVEWDATGPAVSLGRGKILGYHPAG